MINFRLVVTADGKQDLTWFDGQELHSITSDNPAFDAVVQKLVIEKTDQGVLELISPKSAVEQEFKRVSDRVLVNDSEILFDGVPVSNRLGRQILRFLREGSDFTGLVAFLEKLMSNPSERSRNELYDWIADRDFTITVDGDFIAYKGVKVNGDKYESIHSGPAIVDGRQMNGYIPNAIGSVIEISRDYVEDNSYVGCAQGLHAGTWEYASSFAQGAVLEVHINPRDVVSVPTDCNAQKLRVCRYTVVDIVDQPIDLALKYEPDNDWKPDDEESDEEDYGLYDDYEYSQNKYW